MSNTLSSRHRKVRKMPKINADRTRSPQARRATITRNQQRRVKARSAVAA